MAGRNKESREESQRDLHGGGLHETEVKIADDVDAHDDSRRANEQEQEQSSALGRH